MNPRSPTSATLRPLAPLSLLVLWGACTAEDNAPAPPTTEAAPGRGGSGEMPGGESPTPPAEPPDAAAPSEVTGEPASPPASEGDAGAPAATPWASIEVELESLANQNAFAPFAVQSDAEASGGQYIVWPETAGEQALDQPSDMAAGRAEIAFTLSERADLQFEIRVRMPNADDDSFYYSLDFGPWSTQNNGPAGPDWQILAPADFPQLEAGEHTLRLQRREDGAQLDRVTLSASAGTIALGSIEYTNAIAVDLTTEFQTIRGFGGMSPVWAVNGGALTPGQMDTAFGNEAGQLGFSIYRVRIAPDRESWADEIGPAALAKQRGALVLAAPWTPPAEMKTNNDPVGGSLAPEFYGDYTQHLLDFATAMEQGGASLYAISVQNEPDIAVDYESCDWTPGEMAGYLTAQGPRFGPLRVIAADSFNFNQDFTDPLLLDPEVEPHLDIVGGHIYGGGLQDYPLARSLGKEVWMTEHLRDSDRSANEWPLALDVGKELHDSMAANFSAYLWWYLRRSYGPITEDGNVSKRGELMAQYSKFVRPGSVRVAATATPSPNVFATAYKNAEDVVVVVVNTANEPRELTVDLQGGTVGGYAVYATSETKSVSIQGVVPVEGGSAPLTVDAQSVTTLVSQAN